MKQYSVTKEELYDLWNEGGLKEDFERREERSKTTQLRKSLMHMRSNALKNKTLSSILECEPGEIKNAYSYPSQETIIITFADALGTTHSINKILTILNDSVE